jgi:hypothetical protein
VKNHNDQEEFPHYCEMFFLMTWEKEEEEEKSHHLCIMSLRIVTVSQESR